MVGGEGEVETSGGGLRIKSHFRSGESDSDSGFVGFDSSCGVLDGAGIGMFNGCSVDTACLRASSDRAISVQR